MAEFCVSSISETDYVQSNDEKVAFRGTTNEEHNNLGNKVTPTNGQNLKGASETVEVRYGLWEFQFSF